jgi:hypothetical protein
LQHANYLKYNANWGSIYYGDEALLKLGDAGSMCLEARGRVIIRGFSTAADFEII